MAPETKVNGVNIDQLFSTIDLLMENRNSLMTFLGV